MKSKKVKSEEVMRTKQMRMEMSFGEKVEDIWFQHKWFILLGIFCVIVAAFCISDYINRETYDYNLVIATDEEYQIEQTDYLSDCIISFGTDVDGNEKINSNTTVLTYNMLEYDPNTFSANTVLIDNHIAQVDTFIFVMDEYSYKKYSYIKGLFTEDGTELPIDEVGVKLSQTNLAAYAQSAGLKDDLYIILRYFDESYAQAAPSVEVYNKIVNVQ